MPTSLAQSGALPDELPDEIVDIAEGPELEQRDLVIPTAMHGERLDRALAQLLPEFSRSYSQQLLAEGCVNCVNTLICEFLINPLAWLCIPPPETGAVLC